MNTGQRDGKEEPFADYLIERVKRLESELRSAKAALDEEVPRNNIASEFKAKKRRRPYRKPRMMARRGPEEAALIAMRGRLVIKHARRGFDGIPLTTDELLEIHRAQKGLCYYTELPYEFYAGHGDGAHPPLGVTVDRKDHTQGYTRENVVLCAWFVNCAKNAWPMSLIVPLWRFLPTRVPVEVRAVDPVRQFPPAVFGPSPVPQEKAHGVQNNP